MRTHLIGLVVILVFSGPCWASNEAVIERMKRDLYFLAGEECEGRGVETEGIHIAAEYIVEQLREAGLEPGGVDGTWFQPFTISGRRALRGPTEATLTGSLGQTIALEPAKDFQVGGMSAGGPVEAPLVFVGYGISDPDRKFDEYEGLDLKGKIAVILRKLPRADDKVTPFVESADDRYSPLTYKLQQAAKAGAAGVIFVNDRSTAAGGDDLMTFEYTSNAGFDAGFPVIHLRRAVLDRMLRSADTTLEKIEAQIDRDLEPRSLELAGWSASIKADVARRDIAARNVIGVLEGSGLLKDETLIIGAHYDHLGRGEVGSLARGDDRKLIHYGADDNGSGTTSVIELARRFAAIENREGRRIVFMLFSGEERGLLGSRHYANNPIYPLEDTAAMINLDMVGRLRDAKLEVGGTGTAENFDSLIDKLNEAYQFTIEKSPGGMGPSDHAAFYPKQVPVFFFFTGLHPQYHRPTDVPSTINYEGMAKIVDMVEELGTELSAGPKPKYVKVGGGLNPRAGRPSGPRMGFMPGNYDEAKTEGLPVDGVSEGGPAEKAGMKTGDVIVDVGGKPVTNIGTYMTAMGSQKAGEPVKLTVIRAGKKVTITVIPE